MGDKSTTVEKGGRTEMTANSPRRGRNGGQLRKRIGDGWRRRPPGEETAKRDHRKKAPELTG
eukprot:6232400-Prorocentrum_lima.AAC.1